MCTKARFLTQFSSDIYSVRPCVRKLTSIPAVVQKNVTNKSCLVCVMSEKYASWVTLRPQWDRCRRGKAKVRILDFKTKGSEFQMPSQTPPAEAKPRCVYSILKPHGQSFRRQIRLLPKKDNTKGNSKQNLSLFTSLESVPSSCVRKHA